MGKQVGRITADRNEAELQGDLRRYCVQERGQPLTWDIFPKQWLMW